MLSECRAYYHSLETFGTVDGQGIRYVVFLAGCTLGCVFCHNPDTWQRGDQTITADGVLADLAKYRRFYQASGGGLTVTGGEPLQQADFVACLFAECRRQAIHTTLDTSGFCSPQQVETVLPYVDEVLFCIKSANSATHRKITAADNKGILANLRTFAAAVPVVARYVIIPGINDSGQELQELAAVLTSLARKVPVELLAYHTLGRKKWEALGLAYQLAAVPDATAADMKKATEFLTGQGIEVLHHAAG